MFLMEVNLIRIFVNGSFLTQPEEVLFKLDYANTTLNVVWFVTLSKTKINLLECVKLALNSQTALRKTILKQLI